MAKSKGNEGTWLLAVERICQVAYLMTSPSLSHHDSGAIAVLFAPKLPGELFAKGIHAREHILKRSFLLVRVQVAPNECHGAVVFNLRRARTER